MRILATTGIRSEYDILQPVLMELRKRDHEVLVAASGAHLSPVHGNTLDRIREDGFEIVDQVDSLLHTDRLTQRVKGVGLLLTGLSQCVERVAPDLMLTLGDREEQLATAIVGNYMEVITGHIAAGDPVWGNADDPVRHAASKMSHLLLAFTEAYAQNLLDMGEEPFRVFNTGNPSLDRLYAEPELDAKTLSEALGFDVESEPFLVFLKHPLSSTVDETRFQIATALEAVSEFSRARGVRVVGIHPNTDPGSRSIVEEIQAAEEGNERIRFHRTFPRAVFINVMRRARGLVGNSSMGILESMVYPLPVVNVGPRQQGRLHAGNVEFVPYETPAIVKGIEKACFDESYREMVRGLENIYGDGQSAKRIADVVEKCDFKDRKWAVKQHLTRSPGGRNQ